MSTGEPLPPTGPSLGWANRKVFAGREHWPAGALEACERIEAAHPDWYPNYSGDGFRATRRGAKRGEGPLYAEDAAALLAAIEAWAPPDRGAGWPTGW